MSPRSVSVSAGAAGLTLEVPEGVELLPTARPSESGAPLSATAQQELVRAALGPLKELARGRRRVSVLVGDLSLPAPYDLVLPEVVKALLEAEIRPSRIGFVVYPGTGAPILGRGAIHRYGEEIVGDHDLRPWMWHEGWPAPEDAAHAAADLRVAIRPKLSQALPVALPEPLDFSLELTLGRTLAMGVVAAQPAASAPQNSAHPEIPTADVYLAGGGGGEWESTLEEALFSLHVPARAKTVVLAFDGSEGLGSARFANDLWNLIAEANAVLADDGALPSPESAPELFDPAGTVADALSRYQKVVLYSPNFYQHDEGEDLAERLREHAQLGARLKVCGSPTSLWYTLQESHGPQYRLYVEPLGWRA